MKNLSIVIPAYNCERYLARCLDSITAQDNGKIEIIIVNDGSKDNTKAVALLYAEKYGYIKYFEKQNGGVSSARNLAITKISNEYVWFVDGDDRIADGAIEELFSVTCDLAVFNYSCVYDGDKEIFTNVVKEKHEYSVNRLDGLFENYIFKYKIANSLANKVFRSDIILNNALKLDEHVAIGEDYLFCLSYYRFINSITFSSRSIYQYYQNGDSAMHKAHKRAFDYQRIIAEFVFNEYQGKLSKDNINVFLLMQLVCAIGRAKNNGLDKDEIIEKIKEYKKLFGLTFSKKQIRTFLSNERASFLGKLRLKLLIKCFNKERFSLLNKVM